MTRQRRNDRSPFDGSYLRQRPAIDQFAGHRSVHVVSHYFPVSVKGVRATTSHWRRTRLCGRASTGSHAS